MLTSSRMKNLHPYVPGEQPKDRVYIKLNANENPYPPAPSVQKAVLDFVQNHPEKMGLYPDPDSLFRVFCLKYGFLGNRFQNYLIFFFG